MTYLFVFIYFVFFILSSIYVFSKCGEFPTSKYSDFTPDYPGGLLNFGWLISNVAFILFIFYINNQRY